MCYSGDYKNVDDIVCSVTELLCGYPKALGNFFGGKHRASKYCIEVSTNEEARHFAELTAAMGLTLCSGNPWSSYVNGATVPFVVHTDGTYSNPTYATTHGYRIIEYGDLFCEKVNWETDNLDLFLSCFIRRKKRGITKINRVRGIIT